MNNMFGDTSALLVDALSCDKIMDPWNVCRYVCMLRENISIISFKYGE
jgi:hypothetical protein